MSLPQFNFSPEGVQQWQTALYALPDAEVQKEADAAGSDLAAWLPIRFTLNPDQVDFLQGIPPDTTQHWGDSLAYFIVRRLRIVLVKPEAVSTAAQRSWKRVTSEDVTEAQSGQAKQAGERSAVLTFTIKY